MPGCYTVAAGAPRWAPRPNVVGGLEEAGKASSGMCDSDL